MRTALIILFLYTLSTTSHADDTHARIDQSKEITKAFMTELKGELESAMKDGGPVKAISVCNIKAPEIAHKYSTKHNWEVRRTTMKTRNPANSPDKWELTNLTLFEERKTSGEDVDAMAFSEVVTINGQKYFRFMKAIPTGEVCLKCHGSNIDPVVSSKLLELYPNDQARDYKIGDIRGAFSIKQRM